MHISSSIASTLLLIATSYALDIDVSSSDSIKLAAKQVAAGVMGNYTGGQKGKIPGLFCDLSGDSELCSFFTSGATWDAMVDYQFLTGDTQYNDLISQGLLFQIGSNDDYMPANETNSEVRSLSSAQTYHEII
jgi:mannan endo-1,6-alpha-mannosidase